MYFTSYSAHKVTPAKASLKVRINEVETLKSTQIPPLSPLRHPQATHFLHTGHIPTSDHNAQGLSSLDGHSKVPSPVSTVSAAIW